MKAEHTVGKYRITFMQYSLLKLLLSLLCVSECLLNFGLSFAAETATYPSSGDVNQSPNSDDLLRFKIDLKDSEKKPKLTYLGFVPKLDTASNSDNSEKEQQLGAKLTLLVTLTCFTCFLIGTTLTIGVAFFLYRRGKLSRNSRQQRSVMPCDVETQKRTGRMSEYFRFREGSNDEEMYSSPYSVVPAFVVQYNEPEAALENEELLICTWYTGVEQPFVNQFSAKIGYDGGIVKCNDSSVTVTLPQGALPRAPTQRVHVNVSLHDETFNIKPRHGDIQLSPLVEVVCPGVRQFSNPIQVRIPHRAMLGLGNDWLFAVAHTRLGPTQPPLGENSVWRYFKEDDRSHSPKSQVSSKSRRSSSLHRPSSRTSSKASQPDVTFNYDDKYIYIRTSLPGAFTCIGRSEEALLQQNAVVFAGIDEPFGAEGGFTNPDETIVPPTENKVNLRVYICDNFKDSIKGASLADSRSHPYSLLVSESHLLTMYNKKPWAVEIHNVRDRTSPWLLPEGSKSIKSISCSQRLSSLAAISCADFNLSSSSSQSIQVNFTIQQIGDGNQASLINIQTRQVQVQDVYSALSEYIVDDGMAVGSDASSFEDLRLNIDDADLLSLSSSSPRSDNGDAFLLNAMEASSHHRSPLEQPFNLHRTNLQLIDHLSDSSNTDRTASSRVSAHGSNDGPTLAPDENLPLRNVPSFNRLPLNQGIALVPLNCEAGAALPTHDSVPL